MLQVKDFAHSFIAVFRGPWHSNRRTFARGAGQGPTLPWLGCKLLQCASNRAQRPLFSVHLLSAARVARQRYALPDRNRKTSIS